MGPMTSANAMTAYNTMLGSNAGQNNYLAITVWSTSCPTCSAWNGQMYWTYVGTKFAGLNVSQQQTVLIHEMAHPYTGYSDAMHRSGIYDIYGNVPDTCGTEKPYLSQGGQNP